MLGKGLLGAAKMGGKAAGMGFKAAKVLGKGALAVGKVMANVGAYATRQLEAGNMNCIYRKTTFGYYAGAHPCRDYEERSCNIYNAKCS